MRRSHRTSRRPYDVSAALARCDGATDAGCTGVLPSALAPVAPVHPANVAYWLLNQMSKDDLIDMQGTVVAVHSGGLYRVQVDAGHEVLAQLSGRMRRFRIKVVPGDRVTVGISPYDPQRGIITFRAR